MGQALAARGLKPDLALVSEATRTQQTWQQARDAFGPVETQIIERLYDADARTLRTEVEINEDHDGCVLVLAHNPGIHQLAVDYLVESAASITILEKFSGGFPTASCAIFSIDAAGRPSFEGWLTPSAL